jgi:membrane-bound lytic murein transglycosylase D
MTPPRRFARSSLLACALVALAACAPSRAARPAAEPTPSTAEPEEIGAGPALVEESRVAPARPDLLGDAAYDLPVVANSWVEAELGFLVSQRHEVIGRWLERADHYEEHVVRVLEEEGVPTDLHHLAMIESGYLPTARSRAGAVGLWQFMPATGRQMGLRIDDLVDERMDPVRSTRAAARHLRWLHGYFGGDWALAAAAYNAGSGRVARSMQRFDAGDFWDLAMRGDLAAETKHYVPRLYAMTIIGRNRTRFGFPPRVDARVVTASAVGGASSAHFVGAAPALRTVRGAAGFTFDSIQTDLATPFSELARLGDVTAGQLAQLNPHLVRRSTPAGRYWLWVPAGTGAVLQEAYASSDFRRDGGLEEYTVRRGDQLAALLELTGAAPERVRELNAGVDLEKLKAGQKLTLPATMARTLAARPAPKAEPTLASSAAGKRASSAKKPAGAYTEHRIEPGETLWGLARRYDVSVAELQAANAMKGSSTIVPGRTLRVPRAETVVAAAEAEPAKAAAKGGEGQGKSASTERREAARKAEPVRHTVQSGETLWGLARRYGSTIDAIRAANGMQSGVIRPGQTLTIPQ